MPLVSMRQLLDHAAENGYGLPAFNVNNLEQIQAIMEAAAETNSPVIMQGSAGARKYAGEPYLRHLIEAAIETHPDIPIVMHQDHGASPSICIQSMRSGFSSVMMDGSLQEDAKTPASFEYNAKVTRHVVDIAHAIGVSVEGELGCLGSLETGMGEKEDGHGAEGALSHDQLLTDANEAAEFVKATGVDALAIAIGTSHGAYKFTRPPTGAVLRIDRIKDIHARIPNTHLVMHGSSSVPQDWLKIINQYGGDHGRDLWRAGRGNRRGHQARRAQDQHRHRPAHGLDRRDPQVHGRELQGLRSAQVPGSSAQGDEGDLRRPLPGFRLCRTGQQDQTGFDGQDGRALQEGRTERDRQVSGNWSRLSGRPNRAALLFQA
jgi:fructose-bisphosphate aldolase class II